MAQRWATVTVQVGILGLQLRDLSGPNQMKR